MTHQHTGNKNGVEKVVRSVQQTPPTDHRAYNIYSGALTRSGPTFLTLKLVNKQPLSTLVPA